MFLRCFLVMTVCATLSGCVMFPAITLHKVDDFVLPQVTADQVANLPEGAEVEITSSRAPNSTSTTVGTVLKSGPQGVAMFNCVEQGRTISHSPQMMQHVPYFSRLFKNSGVGQTRVPVRWVSAHQIQSIRLINPPPDGYVAPDLKIDLDDSTQFERIGINFDFEPGNETPRITSESVITKVPASQNPHAY